MRMEERRKNKRLDLNVNLQIERLDEGDGITSLKFVEVQVKDMSKTGIGFQTKVPLKINTYYDARITIWTKEEIRSVIEIVRMTKLDDTIEYGGRFIGMTDADALKIDIYQMFNDAN